MQATRDVAVSMVKQGQLEITQKGQVVDPDSFKGPIRLRLPTNADAGDSQASKKTKAQ